MFEHHTQPLMPRRRFYLRMVRSVALAAVLLGGSLTLGVFGYHFIGGLAWIDALLDASMILSGMGPVSTLTTNAAKVFASCYALFSGVMFISTMGILLAAPVHRMMHRFHVAEEKETTDKRAHRPGDHPRGKVRRQDHRGSF